jgi:soluble lytic murein transglycosylase-like protein
VEVLLNSDGLSGAVDAQQQLDRVSEHDQRVIETVRASRARLAEARQELAVERRTAERQRQEAAQRRDALEGLIGQRRAVLAQARSTLGSLLEAEERRRKLAAIAAAQQAEEARLRAVATSPGTSSGGSSPAPATSSPAPTTAPSGSAPAVSGDLAGRLDRIAQCESGGNPRAISPGGTYRGKYQFHPDTWASLGGQGDPAAAPESEQDRLAAILLRQSGSSPWPVCGA